MSEQLNHFKTWFYVIDDQFRIVYTNDEKVAIEYQLHENMPCYKIICKDENQCKKCPICTENKGKSLLYSALHRKWLNVSATRTEWPNVGLCHMIVCSSIEEESQFYVNKYENQAEYSELLELNYKEDTYQIIYRSKYSKNNLISPRSISKAVKRMAETQIIAEDYKHFCDFWQLDHVGKEGIPKKLFIPSHAEFKKLNKDGSYSWVQQHLIPMQRSSADSIYMLNLYNEIDVSNKANNTVAVENDYGIYNRQQFFYHVGEALQQDQGKKSWCIIAIDIEKFKLFNEWYGLDVGNQLLTDIADCLKKLQQQFGFAGFLGDDDFAYFMECDDTLINYLCEEVKNQLRIYSGKMIVLPCFGVKKINNFNDPVIQIYDRAKLACSAVKGNYISRIKWFDLQMLESQQSELLLLTDIQEAFRNHEFYFVLQPKCDMKTGKIIGAEALARWRSKENTDISPSVFIPFLEKSGLITELDTYIWESVCKWQRKRLDQGYSCLPVSVNISRMDMFYMDVPKHFNNLIQKYQLNPSLIELEITESAYVENTVAINHIIKELSQMGFEVLMDDFGSAYSSLNMLKDITMDVIKIDMRFLQWDEKNISKGADILQSVCNMAKMLGVGITAEGVETAEQKKLLLQSGCTNGQGYYFYRPLSVADFETEISKNTVNDTGRCADESNNVCYFTELMSKNMLTQNMLCNMLGAVAFYEVAGDKIEILQCNQKYAEFLHSTDDFEKARPQFGEKLSQEECEKIKEMFESARKDRHNGTEQEIHRKMSDGTDLWLHLRVFFLYHENGRDIFYSAVRDVTDIHRNNDALNFLNNGMPGGYYRHKNNSACEFIHISQRFLDIFGYTREEIKEQFNDKFINMVHPDDRRRVEENMKAMNLTGGNYSQPCRMRSKNGYIHVIDQSRLLNYGDSEFFQGIILCNLEQHFVANTENIHAVDENEIDTNYMPCGVFQSEADGEHHFSYVSNSMLEMLGYSRQEFDEKFKNKTDNLIYYKDRDRAVNEILQQIQNNCFLASEFRIELADGSLKWVYSLARMITDSNGKRWFHSFISDYDYLKEKYQIQEWKLHKYKSLIEAPGAIVFDYDPLNDCLTMEMASNDGENETIVAENYIEKIDTHGFVSLECVEEQKDVLLNASKNPLRGITELKGLFIKDKGYRWYRFHYVSLVNEEDNVYRIVGRGEDITEEKTNVSLLQEKAMKDSLTGLLNFESAKGIINSLIKERNNGVLILLDVDNFKSINDTLGHLMGDKVLVQFTRMLREFFRKDDIVARFGGDEFLVFMPGNFQIETLNYKMQELLWETSQIKASDDIPIHCSIGVADVLEGISFDELFIRADQALYQSKNKGKNTFTIFY